MQTAEATIRLHGIPCRRRRAGVMPMPVMFRSTETAYGGVELRPTTKQQRPGLVAGTLNPLRRYSIETAG
jgi:hypothetical protein